MARHLYAHGVLFKTPVVAQRLLAAALAAPVTVSENAGEGGAWGQALAAAYMLDRMAGGDESLGEFLGREALAGTRGATLCPDEKDVAGFERYLERYCRALAADRALAEALD